MEASLAKKQSPTPLGFDAEWPGFHDLFMAESDRGAALTGAALLDDLLADVIRAGFVDDPKHVESLLKTDGPLGTFSARIKLAYCVGWIGPDVRDDLNLVREVRNKFAHVRTKIEFSDAGIAARCSSAKCLARPIGQGPSSADLELGEEIRVGLVACEEIRRYYCVVVAVVAGTLEIVRRGLERPAPGLGYDGLDISMEEGSPAD
jgi:hypothetical protein